MILEILVSIVKAENMKKRYWRIRMSFKNLLLVDILKRYITKRKKRRKKAKKKKIKRKVKKQDSLQKYIKIFNNISPYHISTDLKRFTYSKFKKIRPLVYTSKIKGYDDHKFIKDMIKACEYDALTSYIGDTVYDFVKQHDDKSQVAWSCDSSGSVFMVGKTNRYQKYYWYFDFDGKYVKEILIDPVLQRIKKLLSKEEDPCGYCEKIQKEIQDKVLHEKILRYIAPKLLFVE